MNFSSSLERKGMRDLCQSTKEKKKRDYWNQQITRSRFMQRRHDKQHPPNYRKIKQQTTEQEQRGNTS